MKKLLAFIVALFFFSATGISAIAGPQPDGNHYVIGQQANPANGNGVNPKMVVYNYGNKTYILGFLVPFGEAYSMGLAATNEIKDAVFETAKSDPAEPAKKPNAAIEYLFGKKDFLGNPKKDFKLENLKLEGKYYVEGVNANNAHGTGRNLDNMIYYDHELTIGSSFELGSPDTTIKTLVEARDEIWGKYDAKAETAGSDLKKLENNIAFRQAYGRHKFAKGADGRTYQEVWAGLMESGVWGTKFKDGSYDGYRLRYDAVTKVGQFTLINEKIKEVSNKDSDGNAAIAGKDDDIYILAYAAILGLDNPDNFALVQAFAVNRKIADEMGDGYNFALSFQGKYKTFGYEGEMDMLQMKWNNSKLPILTEDTTTYGAYLNLWKTTGPFKLGVLGAYGTFDKTNDFRSGSPLTADNQPNPRGGFAHPFGDDFNAGGALLLGDTITFYDADNTAYVADPLVLRYLDATAPDDAAKIRMFNTDIRPRGGGDSLAAGRLVAIYADYSITEKLSLGTYAGYAKSGIDIEGNKWTGASAWELSGKVTYTILPNLQYQARVGIGQLLWGDDTPEPDRAYKLLNSLTFDF